MLIYLRSGEGRLRAVGDGIVSAGQLFTHLVGLLLQRLVAALQQLELTLELLDPASERGIGLPLALELGPHDRVGLPLTPELLADARELLALALELLLLAEELLLLALELGLLRSQLLSLPHQLRLLPRYLLPLLCRHLLQFLILLLELGEGLPRLGQLRLRRESLLLGHLNLPLHLALALLRVRLRAPRLLGLVLGPLCSFPGFLEQEPGVLKLLGQLRSRVGALADVPSLGGLVDERLDQRGRGRAVVQQPHFLVDYGEHELLGILLQVQQGLVERDQVVAQLGIRVVARPDGFQLLHRGQVALQQLVLQAICLCPGSSDLAVARCNAVSLSEAAEAEVACKALQLIQGPLDVVAQGA
mmetsp:Transcript_122794/g.358389  ORF Transcript_122794/g.358389 Transcript_122794/m.358389 type:complete len:360 (-) Transcript_122794:209-1288(-)